MDGDGPGGGDGEEKEDDGVRGGNCCSSDIVNIRSSVTELVSSTNI